MVVKIANIWLNPLDLSGPIDSERKATSSKIQNQSSHLPSIIKCLYQIFISSMIKFLFQVSSIFYIKYDQIFNPSIIKFLYQVWSNFCSKYHQMFISSIIKFLFQVSSNVYSKYHQIFILSIIKLLYQVYMI